MDTQTYRTIVDEILHVEREEAKRTGNEVMSAPRPAAIASAIESAQVARARVFSKDYTALLTAFDGWDNFAWGMSLFGTAELAGEAYAWAEETREYDDDLTPELASALIIGASEDNAALVLLTERGDVVEHMYGEYERHPDMKTFLRQRTKTLLAARSHSLENIARTEREWEPAYRAKERRELTRELRALIATRPESPTLPEPKSGTATHSVSPADLVTTDAAGNKLASVDLGLVLFLAAAPTKDEVIRTFRAFRRCFPTGGPSHWQLASAMSFGLEMSEDPDVEPFAEQLRVDDDGHFGLRVQAGAEQDTHILNIRGVPADMSEAEQLRASFVEVLVPHTADSNALIALCNELAEFLPIVGGHGGWFAHIHSHEGDTDPWTQVFDWCRRFIALEPGYVDGWLDEARRRHRGAGWLTILGTAMVDALGDFHLSKAIERHDAASATVLVAGELTLGDIQRGDFPTAIAEVAAVIEPISLAAFCSHGMICIGGVYFSTSSSQLPGAFCDHHATGAFLRRFVDPNTFIGPSARDVGLQLVDNLRISMDPSELQEWGRYSELDNLDTFRDLMRALFNGANLTPDKVLSIAALEHVCRFPDWSPPPAYNNLLVAYFGASRFDDALEIMPVALQTAAQNPHTYHSGACVFTEVGRLDEAVACVRQAKAAAYLHMNLIATDDDLRALRSRVDFQELVGGEVRKLTSTTATS